MKQRGSIAMATILLLLLSCASLGVLTQVLDHERIVRAREMSLRRAETVHNGLIPEVHLTIRDLAARRRSDVLPLPTPESLLRCEPLSAPFALQLCHQLRLRYRGPATDPQRVLIDDTVRATDSRGRSPWKALLRADILQGDIPLPQFGVWIGGEPAADPPIDPATLGLDLRSGLPVVQSTSPLRGEAGDLLLAALSLSARRADYRQLRERLGLPPGDSAPPAGVYPITAGPQVLAVYVQGDVDRLTLQAQDGRQQVLMTQGNGEHAFRYTPGAADWQVVPRSPELLRFAERILVNGAIRQLTGEPGPALLAASRLLIASSDTITITGDLEIAEDETEIAAPLTVLAGRRDLVTGERRDGGLVLAGKGGMRVRAHLVTEGAFRNAGGAVMLRGTLAAGKYEAGSRVTLDCRLPAPDTPFPVSSGPVTLIRAIRLLGIWEETHEP
ncbi:MAG TPA: hypothetical protein PKK12_05045 [Candidatus Aminicenantes bacterium]|nr:hypothetical protein [Candidatus Aminicenantes bacterium]